MACPCLCKSAAQQRLDQTRDYEDTAVSYSLARIIFRDRSDVHFGFRLSSSAVVAHPTYYEHEAVKDLGYIIERKSGVMSEQERRLQI